MIRGSAATTSPATTPRENGTSRAAAASADAAAAAARGGSRPLARYAARIPVKHVAGARRGELWRIRVDDEDAAARARDERVGALQEADAAEPRRRATHCLEAVLVDPRRLLTEQAAQLARMRRHHDRRPPVARLEVEQARRRRARRADRAPPANGRADPSPPPCGPGPGRSQPRRPSATASPSSAPVSFTGSSELRLHDRKRRVRHGDGDVAGVGAERRLGGQAGCACQAGCAADDEHRAGRVLVVLGPLAGHELEDLLGDEPVLGRRPARGRCRRTRPRPRGTGPAQRPARASAPWNVTVSAASTTAPATSPVEASTPDGQIDGDDRRLGRVHPLDQRRRLRPRRAAEAGPEERVHDQLRVLDGVRLDRLAARLAQHPRRDAPVTAVRAAPADDGDAARVREAGEHGLRHRGAGALHQLRDRLGIAADSAPPRRASPRRCRAARGSG